MNITERLKKDLEGIYIGNLNTVDSDLRFPERGGYGSAFAWETSDWRFIEADGKVHRPVNGMGDRKVVIKVTACLEGECATREFTATVLQEVKVNRVARILDTRVNALLGGTAVLPPVVIAETEDGRYVTMPVRWDTYKPLDQAGELEVWGEPEETVGNADKADSKSDKSVRKARAVISYQTEISAKHGPGKVCSYYPVNRVRLLEGTPFYRQQRLMTEYLRGVDDDQMLYNFRKAAGLDTLGAAPMTGWDEESCKLKGHTTGHYLSGIALAWGATGEECFRKKVDYMVAELAKCQEAFAASGKYHPGFLSAYSEEQFDKLETFTKYPEIWAPYYTLDKIMAGLCDCFVTAGNQQAKEILTRLGDWVYDRLSRLSQETLNRMWGMYIAGEFGGMIGTMVRVYRITGKKEHLEAARLFENPKLFCPMEADCDTLEGMHANQHIPQAMGAVDLYAATGNPAYWEIGKNFWDIVTGGHIYVNGGTGETEMFRRAGTTCSYLTDKAAESCASYNMLRLTGQLFAYDSDARRMEYYDNTLRNHILASGSHTHDGGTTYFMPMGPGQRKEYTTTENTCCHGTGLESRFRYLEQIFAEDAETVYVNLWIDSSLLDEQENEIFRLSGNGEGEFTLVCRKEMKKKLKLRIPEWAQEDFAVSVNGSVEYLIRDLQPEKSPQLSAGYLTLAACRAGDTVQLAMPMKLRILENSSDSSFVNLAWGPYLLAALSESREFFSAPPLESLQPDGTAGHFKADGIRYIPFCEVDQESYHIYFKR